jgi:hypothetical protein
MLGMHRQYVREVHSELGLWASWPPQAAVNVGDVGALQDGVFRRHDTLAERRIAFRTRRGLRGVDFEHRSNGGVEISSAVAARPLPDELPVSVAVKIRFTRRGAMYLAAADCTIEEMVDQDLIGQEIVQRFSGGFWKSGDLVVTEVMRCSSFTLLVSSGGDSGVELSVEGGAFLPVGVGVKEISSKNITTKIVSERGLTPFFRCRRLRPRMLGLGDPVAVFRGGSVDRAEAARQSLDELMPLAEPVAAADVAAGES